MFGHDEHQPGIVPLAISDIYDQIERAGRSKMFFVRLSALEIYNEKLSDLACETLSHPYQAATHNNKPLRLRETKTGFIFVENLVEEVCSDKQSALDFLYNCLQRRHMAETMSNQDSSRSHVICKVIVESRVLANENGDAIDFESAPTIVGELNFVDLAGSECAVKLIGPNSVAPQHTIGTKPLSNETMKRLKEGKAINRSLLMLGIVINQLCERRQVVNYRNSKLTRILQNALGGNCLTAIVCTVAPTDADKRETVSSLQFASNAKSIKTKPRLNETYSADQAVLKRLHLEIERLRRRILELEQQQRDQANSLTGSNASASSEQVKLHENRRLLMEMLAGGRWRPEQDELNLLNSNFNQQRQDKMLFNSLSRRMTWAPAGSGHAVLMLENDNDGASSTKEEPTPSRSSAPHSKQSERKGLVLNKVSVTSLDSLSQNPSPTNGSTISEPIQTTIERLENESEFHERFVEKGRYEEMAKNYQKLKGMLESSLGASIREDDDFDEVHERLNNLLAKSEQQSVATSPKSVGSGMEPLTSLAITFGRSGTGGFRMVRRAVSAKLPSSGDRLALDRHKTMAEVPLNYQSDLEQSRPKSATITSTIMSRATTIVVERPIIETSEPGNHFCDNENDDNANIVQDQFEEVLDHSAVSDEEEGEDNEGDVDNEGEYPVDDDDDDDGVVKEKKRSEEDGSGMVQDQFGYQLPNDDGDD